MKKVVVVVLAVVLLGMLLSSCKTHERCPAYGKSVTTKSERPS